MSTAIINFRNIFLLCLIAILTSCVSVSNEPEITPEIFWPPPPTEARVTYLTSFTTADDLGIKPGLWENLKSIFIGNHTRKLVRPMSVVETPNKDIYVADAGAGGIHRFNVRNNEYEFILREGNKILPSPVALAIGPDNSVFIVDSALGKIFQVEASQSSANPILTNINFEQPSGITYSLDKKLFYISDTNKHEIKIINENGTLIKSIGQRGNSEAEFNFPTYLWLNRAGDLFVADSLNFRVQIFDGEGNFITKFGSPGDGTGNFSRPKGIAVDENSNIWVADSVFNVIQIFNQQGELLLSLGSGGNEPGQLLLPAGIFISQDRKIFIADSLNQRIQILGFVGELN